MLIHEEELYRQSLEATKKEEEKPKDDSKSWFSLFGRSAPKEEKPTESNYQPGAVPVTANQEAKLLEAECFAQSGKSPLQGTCSLTRTCFEFKTTKNKHTITVRIPIYTIVTVEGVWSAKIRTGHVPVIRPRPSGCSPNVLQMQTVDNKVHRFFNFASKREFKDLLSQITGLHSQLGLYHNPYAPQNPGVGMPQTHTRSPPFNKNQEDQDLQMALRLSKEQEEREKRQRETDNVAREEEEQLRRALEESLKLAEEEKKKKEKKSRTTSVEDAFSLIQLDDVEETLPSPLAPYPSSQPALTNFYATMLQQHQQENPLYPPFASYVPVQSQGQLPFQPVGVVPGYQPQFVNAAPGQGMYMAPPDTVMYGVPPTQDQYTSSADQLSAYFAHQPQSSPSGYPQASPSSSLSPSRSSTPLYPYQSELNSTPSYSTQPFLSSAQPEPLQQQHPEQTQAKPQQQQQTVPQPQQQPAQPTQQQYQQQYQQYLQQQQEQAQQAQQAQPTQQYQQYLQQQQTEQGEAQQTQQQGEEQGDESDLPAYNQVMGGYPAYPLYYTPPSYVLSQPPQYPVN